jgi:hypothetical protein
LRFLPTTDFEALGYFVGRKKEIASEREQFVFGELVVMIVIPEE